MADSRRSFCGFLFWLKAFFAFCAVCSLLGYEAYMVYNMRIEGLANLKKTKEFEKIVGGKDTNHTAKVIINPTLPECQIERVTTQTVNNHIRTSGNRLEPPNGIRFFGFALDFSWDTPTKIMARLGGRAPPVIAAFLTVLPNGVVDSDMINWWALETSAVGGILELTIVPNTTLDALPATFYNDLTNILYLVNQRYAVPVLLRYAHEMNGNWNFYGQRPTAFKESWIRLTTLLRQKTNMTAMMWGVNAGSGYPYGAPVPVAGSADFRALDTNNDGAITITDDPYGPFWPGAEYVDWIAISMYNYDYNIPTAQYNPVPANYLVQQLSGPWPGVATSPYQDFYTRFVDTYAKPFAFPESGSPIVPTPAYTVQQQIANKQAWWNQIMNIFNIYPNLKLVVNFEIIKVEEANGVFVNKDFTITNSTEMTKQFLTDISAFDRTVNANSVLAWGTSLNYTCGGKVTVK